MLERSFRPNNFDLIRLLAATQVLASHAIWHLNLNIPSSINILLGKFPGVPIFFVISGFLISASWEKNPNIKTYIRNRILRIYPALWICLLVSICMAVVFGGVNFLRLQAIPWFLSQISFVQFFNPEFLRNYGVGTLNGSLWTIPVELQFYIILPLLYYIFSLYKPKISRKFYIFFAVCMVASLVVSKMGFTHIVEMIFSVTLLPHLYMFMVGIILQKLKLYEHSAIFGKGLLWIVIYLAFSFLIIDFPLKLQLGNILLAVSIVSMAYSSPLLATRALKGRDISYGVYLYHMVFINIFVELGLTNNEPIFLLATILTFLTALLSWIFIEKPTLSRKTHSTVRS